MQAGRQAGWRALAIVGSALLPLAVVLFLPAIAGWGRVLPEVFEPKGDATSVAELLGNLSLSLSSIAIATVIGAGIILRERAGTAGRGWPLALSTVIVGACFVAVYSGYRFQMALAEQLSVYQLEMDRVGDRLEWQAASVLACACFLISLAVDTFVLNRPRPEAPEKPRRGARPHQRKANP